MTTKTIGEDVARLRRCVDTSRSMRCMPTLIRVIDELAALRTQVETLTAERDQWQQRAQQKADDVVANALHALDMQAVVRAEEREACAKVCEEYTTTSRDGEFFAAVIRRDRK